MTGKKFEGRIALVTGASRGLGYATAEALGREGAQVVAVARTVGGLEALDDAVRAAGGLKPVLVPLDLTDEPGVERLGAALFERFGKLDMVIHCAAESSALGPVAHIKPKDLTKFFAVNVGATQGLIRSMDPLLRAAPSPQLLVCVDDKAGEKFWGTYGASKAAAAALTESYAAETAGVRVHLYEPPAMPTALRARPHPGEDKSALTPCAEAAEGLVALLE